MPPKRKRGEAGGGGGRIVKGRMEADEGNTHQQINSSDVSGTGEQTRDCASCHKHFPTVESYKHHYLIKKANVSAKLVPASGVRKFSHIILCPKSDCCFSTNNKQSHKIHLITHGMKPSGELLVIPIGEEDEFLTAHQCRICCQVLGTANALQKHQQTCRGKFLFSCNYCSSTFRDRQTYTDHLLSDHAPVTDFQVTGVFVGREKKIERKRGLSAHMSSERSIVMLTPGITSVGGVFTEGVISSIRKLLEWEIAAHNRVSTRIVCNSIVSKDNGDEVNMVSISITISNISLSDYNQTLCNWMS